MKAHELLPSRGGLALPACEGASRLQPAAVWALLSEGFLPSSARKAEIAPPTGAHHKTSNLVGAGEEAGRVGVHLLVLQPWGRAVGGLPAQGLPEAVCEGRWHQSPIDTITPPSPPPPALLPRPQDEPCSPSPPSTFKSQGAKEGRGLRDSKVMKQRPREGRLGSRHTARTSSGLRLTTALWDGDNYPHSTNEAQRGQATHLTSHSLLRGAARMPTSSFPTRPAQPTGAIYI